jgi:anti-sigma-K factor RskA
MIDERQEELATLYALDLLEGAELAQFEAAIERDPQLRSLVKELRDTSASLAHTAPRVLPPDALKQRILSSISDSAKTETPPDNIVRPAFRIWNVLPWATAACFAIGAAWLGQGYLSSRTEAEILRQHRELADITIQSTRQQLEAERIIAQKRLLAAEKQQAETNTQLADARNQLSDTQNRLGDRERLLAEARNQLVERDRLLAVSRSQLTERDRQVTTLSQRIEALAGASAEIGRQLGDARQQVAQLTNELKSQGALADLTITALASMLKNSPQALAVAVWDPGKQEGVLKIQNLPPLGANEDYQFWIVDPQYPNPVDGGVFRVDPATGTLKFAFKPKQPVTAVNAFAVTRERKGGVVKAQGPFVLLGK